MKAMRLWQGVRMRQVAAAADPDCPSRLVTLPVSWDDRAAEALAALLPGHGPVSMAAAASVWLTMIGARARQAGQNEGIAPSLQMLLQHRQAAPTAPVWRCEAGVVGFRLNAAGFHTAGGGYDVSGFAQAAGLVARACRLLAPAAHRYEIGLSGLDDLLACAGLPYDSQAARLVGACLAALLRASVEHALESEQRDLLATGANWPPPPPRCALPGLAEAAGAAHASLLGAPGVPPATGVFQPGPADALLGIETGGIAPAFGPVRDKHLTRATQNRLAASALSPEAALAAVLMGETPLRPADRQAHEAMLAAVAPYLDTVPSLPANLPAPPGDESAPPPGQRHEKLPARTAGMTKKVSVGSHRVFLRTAEYADGRLGEISLSLPRESATVRGLAESFAQAVSLGLQNGVRLEDFVEAFTLTRFGPAGAVEGDPDVERATSVLDYVFRSLSASYLGRALPPPEGADDAAPDSGSSPLLPLDLPTGRSPRRLRLVA
jgi:hypothetical protein